MEQFSHPVTYNEAKTIIHNQYSSEWKRKLNISTGDDPIHQLQRHQQTILFRLRTGHCRLLNHLHRLKISHTDQCQCGLEPRPPNISSKIAQPTMLCVAKPGQRVQSSRTSCGAAVKTWRRQWTSSGRQDCRSDCMTII